MSVVPCANIAPVRGIVEFLPADFVLAFPEFTGLTNGSMVQSFARATLQLNNTCGSRVTDANTREVLLNLLTAHILFLNYGTNDGAGNITPAPGIVGRISDATEGSVSVSAVMEGPANWTAAYYMQTRYGAEYWTATARWRTMLYVPAPCDAGALGPVLWPSSFGNNNGPF